MEEKESGGMTAQLAATQSASGRPLVAISDAVDRACTFAFVMATVAFALIMLVGVFFRYVLNDSLAWSDEVGLMVFTWAIFLSIASGYLHDKHVNLDLLINKARPEVRAVLSLLAEGLSLGFLVSMSVSGVYALQFASRMRTDALQWPMWIPYLSIPVACTIMDLHWLRRNAERGTTEGLAVKLGIAAAFFTSATGFGSSISPSRASSPGWAFSPRTGGMRTRSTRPGRARKRSRSSRKAISTAATWNSSSRTRPGRSTSTSSSPETASTEP